MNTNKNKDNQRGFVAEATLIIGFVVLMAIGVMFLMSFKSVDAGTVKVVKRWGGTTGRVLQPGANWITPIVDGTETLNTREVIYETADKVEQEGSNADYKDFPIETNTSDGQSVVLEYTINFSIDPNHAVDIINNFGSEETLVENIVKTRSRIVGRTVAKDFTAEEIYVGNSLVEVEDLIVDQLRSEFSEKGIILHSFGIRDVSFNSEYTQAIEQKQIEAVKVETAKKIAERAEQEKQAAIRKAEGEAEAQRLQRESLSAEVIEKTRLDVELVRAEALKISAEKGIKIVPDTVLGDSNGLLFNLGQ